MFAEVISGMISASAPIFQAPKLSPMSQLRSMLFMCPSTPVLPCDGLDNGAETLLRRVPGLPGFLQGALDEMHTAAGRKLRKARNVRTGDFSDLRVTARRLVIGHERNRRSVIGHLHCPQAGRLR